MDAQEISIVDEPKVGTATWMIPPTVKEVFPYSEGAVWLGRNGDDARTPIGRKDESHVLLCAMNRSAKGRAIITNNLLLWKGSVVCNDPKGENASVTAARRGQGSKHVTKPLGQKVCVLDSHSTAKVDDQYRAYYNVLDELDPNDPDTPSKAWDIAESFITDDAKKDGTWDEMAKPYMRAILLHIITAPVSKTENDGNIPADERDLITFRRFILRGDFYAEEYFKARKTPEELAAKQISGHKLLLQRMTKNMAFGGIIADEAESRLKDLEMHDRFFNSVRSSAVNATAWIDDPMIRDVLRAGKYQNTFRAAELETDSNGVSVFVCLRLKEQKKLAAWPRLIMNMVLASAQEDYFRSPATGHNTLMMLDEFAALERMQSVENAAPAIAGAGIKLFMVLQNLSQMKAVYGENFEAFMANAGTHIYYGFNDNFTAEYVKKRLGEIEVIRHMRTNSKGTMTGDSESEMGGGGTNTGTSSSVTRGWSPSLFHLSFFTSKQKAKNQNTGSSESWSETVTKQRSETDTTGWTQQLHKKPLADVHELMQMFGAIEDSDAPNFPGIGLVSTAEKAPALVQKSFYDQDRAFEGMFDPHPKHGFTPLPVPKTETAPQPLPTPAQSQKELEDFSNLPAIEPSRIYKTDNLEESFSGFLKAYSKLITRQLGPTLRNWSIAILPNENLFLTAGESGCFKWDIRTGEVLNRIGSYMVDDKFSIRASDDGRLALVTGISNGIELLDIQSGKKIAFFEGHTEWTRDAIFLSSKNEFVSVGWDARIFRWNIETGQKFEVGALKALDSKGKPSHYTPVINSVEYIPESNILVTVCGNGMVHSWNLTETSEKFIPKEWGRHSPPRARKIFGVNPQKTHAVSHLDGWHTYKWAYSDKPKSSFNHENYQVVDHEEPAALTLWELGTEVKAVKKVPFRHSINVISYSPSGRHFATGHEHEIVLWDAGTFTPVNRFKSEIGVTDIKFAPSGDFMLAAGVRPEILMWDISHNDQGV